MPSQKVVGTCGELVFDSTKILRPRNTNEEQTEEKNVNLANGEREGASLAGRWPRSGSAPVSYQEC